jgi:uncharacterized membrane protein HdeD (DUF308 family)
MVPLFAESISSLVAVVFLLPIVLGIASRVAMIALKRRRGERPWWGLAIGALSILCGAAVLIMLFTTRGGAPPFFYLVGVFPLLAGVACLIIWGQKPRI